MHYHLAMQPAVDKFSVQAGLQRRICPLLAIGREAPASCFRRFSKTERCMADGRKSLTRRVRASWLAKENLSTAGYRARSARLLVFGAFRKTRRCMADGRKSLTRACVRGFARRGLQRRICPLLAIGREAPGFLFSALLENKKMHGGRKEKSDKARACKLACKGEFVHCWL